MLLAAEEAAKAAAPVDVFDFFVLAFTILIALGVIRTVSAKQKNVVAIGFGLVSLAVFLFMDYVMITGWLGI